MRNRSILLFAIASTLALLALAGCGAQETATPTAPPDPTATSAPPTSTPTAAPAATATLGPPVFGTETDIDGNEYRTVKIGDQWWMAENLRVTRYNNGDPIPTGFDDDAWIELTTGAFSPPEHGEAGIITRPLSGEDVETYGLLYNWYAAVDNRGVCPEGWHVPSDEEWMELELRLGVDPTELEITGPRGTNQGGMLKETGTEHWSAPNTGATNETGFSALGHGGRTAASDFPGEYWYRGERGSWWTSTEYYAEYALDREVRYADAALHRVGLIKANGTAIRCIMD
jgi:uncharacterized protein (TIGR02145 family)